MLRGSWSKWLSGIAIAVAIAIAAKKMYSVAIVVATGIQVGTFLFNCSGIETCGKQLGSRSQSGAPLDEYLQIVHQKRGQAYAAFTLDLHKICTIWISSGMHQYSPCESQNLRHRSFDLTMLSEFQMLMLKDYLDANTEAVKRYLAKLDAIDDGEVRAIVRTHRIWMETRQEEYTRIFLKVPSWGEVNTTRLAVFDQLEASLKLLPPPPAPSVKSVKNMLHAAQQ